MPFLLIYFLLSVFSFDAMLLPRRLPKGKAELMLSDARMFTLMRHAC